MDEDALAGAHVVQAELARGVLALDRARLDAVELDRRAREHRPCDLRPERAEDDRFQEVLVLRVRVERRVGGRGGVRDEA